MERTQQLQKINQDICNYYEQFNIAAKEDIFCFHQAKKELTTFYSTMQEQIMEQKLQKDLETSRKLNREAKVKQRIMSSIKNPLATGLPKEIKQKNMLEFDKISELKMRGSPLFTGVQVSKKGNYEIADEVREMVSEDIKKLIESKQEKLFRKKYPVKQDRLKQNETFNSQKTQNKIKNYNQLVAKFKNEEKCDELQLIDEFNYPQLLEELILDHQFFNVLDLFKKLYTETKSQYFNDGLIKYILKFQKIDKLSNKIKPKSSLNKKFNIRKSDAFIGSKQSLVKNESISVSKKRDTVLSQNQKQKQSKKKSTVTQPHLFKTRILSTKKVVDKDSQTRLRL